MARFRRFHPGLAVTVRLVLGAAAALGPLAGCDSSTEEALEGPAGGFVRTAAVERGRQLYQRHGCAGCHGSKGRGDGRLAPSLQLPAPDLSDPASYRRGRAIEQLMATIAQGIVVEDRRVMPAFGHLSAADRRNLALYLRSLAVAEPAPEAAPAADADGPATP